MAWGRVLQAVSRAAGASTVGDEAVGQTIISIDNVRDFIQDSGFVIIDGAVAAYTAVDRINETITLASALTTDLPAGTYITIYPASVKRWVFVEPSGIDLPSDAVWCLLPHALAAFVAEDGLREEGQQEIVEYMRDGVNLLVTDIKDKQPQLTTDAIPDGLITETKIAPGSITTPLLAANSVATQHLQFGAATGDVLAVDALNGKTITGALVRSAESGKRVEFNSAGLKQYDDAGGVTLSIGDQNKFTGEIDATSEVIRDSLQLFGRNNLFGTGSQVTLKARTGDPSQPPTVVWDYEDGPGINGGAYWYPTGVHSVGGAFHSATYVFLNQARYYRSDGKYWNFPETAPGSGVSTYKAWSMVRIAKADTGAERVVMIGEDQAHIGTNGYPEIWMRVYDDSSMNTSGTAPPILLAQWKVTDFSWDISYKLGRHVNGTADRNKWVLYTLIDPTNGGNKTLKWAHYQWQNADNGYLVLSDNNMGAVVGNSYKLAGGALGSRSNLKIDTTNGGLSTDTMLVVALDGVTCVYNVTAATWETNSYWVKGWKEQARQWTDGDPVAGTMTNYYATNWAEGANIQTYKYTNSALRLDNRKIWAAYTWRGEASTSLESVESPWTSIDYRRRAMLKVTMPPLPTPIAGVGGARDPAKDVYGWRYYVAQAITPGSPADVYAGPNNPTLAPNTPLAQTVVTLDTWPTNTGAVPPATTNFPASSPASIKSDNGLLTIDGDGNIVAATIKEGSNRVIVSEAWTTYTPVWTATTTNPSLGNGTLSGRFSKQGRYAHFELLLVIGSTTTFGSGRWEWTLPVEAVLTLTTAKPFGWAIATDNGTRQYGHFAQHAGTTRFFCWRDAGASEATITPATPFTWVNTDFLSVHGSYECVA